MRYPTKALPVTAARRTPVRSPSRYQLGWVGLALLFLASGAPAQAPDFKLSDSPPADEEPIMPIPTLPAANPLKLALGESLFEDHRLSRDPCMLVLPRHSHQWRGRR